MADVATDETQDLISSDKVEGTPVFNTAGEKLGSIYTLMINKRSGKVAYAVMSFGGFLGIGEEYNPVPWDVLVYDTSYDGYVIDADRAKLEAAPRYRAGEQPAWHDRAYHERVHRHYGSHHPSYL